MRDETAWTYDNTQNSKPHVEEWTEKWTNTSSATLTVGSSGMWFSPCSPNVSPIDIVIHGLASITLSNHITIFDVAESGFDITISSESSSSESKEETYELSHTWTME